MASHAIKIPMAQAMRGLTLHMVITGMVRARIRIWLGTRFLLLGAWVAGMNVEVVVKPEGKRPA